MRAPSATAPVYEKNDIQEAFEYARAIIEQIEHKLSELTNR